MSNYKVFDAYKTSSVGIWYFAPKEGAFKNGKPCKGFGSIKYPEGSVYTGDIYYDGKNFNKLGYGKQNFTRSDIGKIIPALGEKKYLFTGSYDYRKTEWIYGNGVLYYTDGSGRPSHFKKGFFRGLEIIGEYKGKFDYSTLLDGYTPDMEFDYDERKALWGRILSSISSVRYPYTLCLGDSYFELFADREYAGEKLFNKVLPDNFVNAGIGGSKFSDWLLWTKKLEDAPAPDKIIINLGFNDLHSGASVAKTYSDFRKFNAVLKSYFPETKIYLISVVHSPAFTNYFEQEREYNAKIARCAAKNGVTVVEWNSLITESGASCFHADAIHPNERGYALFASFIKELLIGEAYEPKIEF